MPWKKGAGFAARGEGELEGRPLLKRPHGKYELVSAKRVARLSGWQSRAAVPFGLVELKQLPDPQGKFLTTAGPKSIPWDF